MAGEFETTPLVFDRRMFITGPSNHAWALDAFAGRPLWRYESAAPGPLHLCCGQVNRGFAASGNRLFKVNIEGALVALDALSGDVLWEARLEDFRKGYSATGAPLAVKNLVLTGIAGGEFGTRGFIDAYDARTGKRAWRFYTVPAPGEPGAETWAGDSGRHGGGATWITGAYDPALNLVFWGTGNPGPDFNGDGRKGDNLYTCSVVALDADTGALKWHYQFTPHDTHDWDAAGDLAPVDLTIEGRTVKALIHANRNGYFYALDRASGRLLHAKAYTRVTWAEGIGADGRPIAAAGQEPTEAGTRTCPGTTGGHNWQATAYSPQTGLYYFSSTERCELFYKTALDYAPGRWFQASATGGGEAGSGRILAVDPATGETKWQFEMISPPTAGMLATAGGLVFSGDAQGYLIAFDARTGKALWKFQAGGPIVAPPIAYALAGRQYIAVAAGSSIVAFALPAS